MATNKIVRFDKARVLNRTGQHFRSSQEYNSFHHSSYNNYTNLADIGVLAFLIPLSPVSESNASSSNVSFNDLYSDANEFIKQKLQKHIQNDDKKVLALKDGLQPKNNTCVIPQYDKQTKNKSGEGETKDVQNSSDIANDIYTNQAKSTAEDAAKNARSTIKNNRQDVGNICIAEKQQSLSSDAYSLNANPLLEVPKSGL